MPTLCKKRKGWATRRSKIINPKDSAGDIPSRPTMKITRKRRNELWTQLLSDRRLYGQIYPTDENSRSEYQKDHDRIVFSSAFRRLQDKTQVFPLSQTDYTRTRLTHSLEVSSVARTLGVLAAKHLVKLGVKCEPHDVATIVATAALAHDLGNPPFGHSGEAAIQSWARKRLPQPLTAEATIKATPRTRRKAARGIPMCAEEVADFYSFEGNAQGFRILVRTAARQRKGGLRPTIATLGAMAKYPRPSMLRDYEFRKTAISERKPGYFQNDRTMAVKAFRGLGMIERRPGVFSRHPLAFLTEAADDICYAVADIEDGFKMGVVSFEEVRDVLLPIASTDTGFAEATYMDYSARISRIRASTLAVLVSACSAAFRENLEEMEKGDLDVSLLDRTKISQEYQNIKALAKHKVYRHDRVLQIEYAGYQTIGGLLDMFYSALCDSHDQSKDEKLRRLLPRDFVWRAHQNRVAREGRDPIDFALEFMTPYERLLTVTDYVSGMTDRFAVQLFQSLSGIRLPE
jgi:dGTPase